MITYIYWTALIALVCVLLYGFGVKTKKWKVGVILSLVILIAGWGAYYFRLQQTFVKRYGGVMTIHVPEGQLHMGTTWKEDHLWIENYDPETNTCYFSEYSKGNLLQGKVTLTNCNPLLPRQ